MAHGLCERKVTCAAMGCHHPGTVLVPLTSPPKVLKTGDGRDRWLEGTVVELEFCPECAAQLKA